MFEKISSGSVRISEDTINSETVTLSNEVKKENRAPDRIAGRISGSVTRQKTVTGLAPRMMEVYSQAIVLAA